MKASFHVLLKRFNNKAPDNLKIIYESSIFISYNTWHLSYTVTKLNLVTFHLLNSN